MSNELLSADDSPRVAESVPVILARMEGKLDIVNLKVDNLSPRVSSLELRTDKLENDTLALSLNAGAEEAKKVALALALKEADENRRAQSEQTWTPAQRVMTVLGSIGGILTLVIYWTSTH